MEYKAKTTMANKITQQIILALKEGEFFDDHLDEAWIWHFIPPLIDKVLMEENKALKRNV